MMPEIKTAVIITITLILLIMVIRPIMMMKMVSK